MRHNTLNFDTFIDNILKALLLVHVCWFKKITCTSTLIHIFYIFFRRITMKTYFVILLLQCFAAYITQAQRVAPGVPPQHYQVTPY